MALSLSLNSLGNNEKIFIKINLNFFPLLLLLESSNIFSKLFSFIFFNILEFSKSSFE